MKTAELTGEWLDYWVARTEGHEVDPPLAPGQEWPDREKLGRKYEPNYIEFSTKWQFGGPIIERDRIAMWLVGDEGWNCYPQGQPGAHAKGPTPLIAAMRAKVASVYGEEVPDL